MCVALLVFGGLVCAINFYLGFIRYPLFRLRGGRREDYRWVSGLPLIGSLFVAASLACVWDTPLMRWSAIGLIVIDTGGPHWFLGVLTYQWLKGRSSRDRDQPGNDEGHRG